MRKNPKFVWQLETVNEQLSRFSSGAAAMARVDPRVLAAGQGGTHRGHQRLQQSAAQRSLSRAFCRSLVLGKEYWRCHVPGIRQDVFEVPDLMCGTSQVPQILAPADYRYFMFTRPSARRPCSG